MAEQTLTINTLAATVITPSDVSQFSLDDITPNIAVNGEDITEHVDNTEVHITTEERTKWNNKADESFMGLLQPQGDLAGCDSNVTACAFNDGGKGGLFSVEGVITGVKVCCAEDQAEGVEVGVTLISSGGKRIASDNTCVAGPGKELKFTFATLAECDGEKVNFVIFVLPDKRGSNQIPDAVNLSLRGTAGSGNYLYTTPEMGEGIDIAVWFGVEVQTPNFAPYGLVQECKELTEDLAKQETTLGGYGTRLATLEDLAEQQAYLQNMRAKRFLAIQQHPAQVSQFTIGTKNEATVRSCYALDPDGEVNIDYFMRVIETSNYCTAAEVRVAFLKHMGLTSVSDYWFVVPLVG